MWNFEIVDRVPSSKALMVCFREMHAVSWKTRKRSVGSEIEFRGETRSLVPPSNSSEPTTERCAGMPSCSYKLLEPTPTCRGPHPRAEPRFEIELSSPCLPSRERGKRPVCRGVARGTIPVVGILLWIFSVWARAPIFGLSGNFMILVGIRFFFFWPSESLRAHLNVQNMGRPSLAQRIILIP